MKWQYYLDLVRQLFYAYSLGSNFQIWKNLEWTMLQVMDGLNLRNSSWDCPYTKSGFSHHRWFTCCCENVEVEWWPEFCKSEPICLHTLPSSCKLMVCKIISLILNFYYRNDWNLILNYFLFVNLRLSVMIQLKALLLFFSWNSICNLKSLV